MNLARDIMILFLALAAGLSTGWRWGPRREIARVAVTKSDAIAETPAAMPAASTPATPNASESTSSAQPPDPSIVLAVMLDEWDAEKAWPVLCAYTAEQLSGLIDECEKAKDQQRGRQLIELALRAWARLDFAAAMSRAKEEKVERFRGRRIGAVLASLVLQSPDEAMKQAQTLRGNDEKDAATSALIEHWAVMDRKTALAWYDSHPEVKQDHTAIKHLLGKSAAFTDRAAEALSLKRKDFREASLDQIVRRWSEAEPAAAYRFLAERGTLLSNEPLVTAAGEWGEVDPVAALASASQIPDEKLRNLSIRSVIGGSLQSGQAGFVLNLLGNHPSPDISAAVAKSLRWHFDELNWPEFDQIITVLPDSESKRIAISNAAIEAGEFLRHDRMVQLLVHLPDSKQRQEALQASCMMWQAISPESLAAWMAELSSVEDRDWAMAGMASGQAMSRPQEAAALLDQVSSAEAKKALIRSVAGNWMASDPAAAKAWVNGLEGIGEIERAELLERTDGDW